MTSLSTMAAFHCERANSNSWQQFDQFPSECFMQKSAWLRSAWENYHSQQTSVTANSLHFLNVTDAEDHVCGQSAWFKQFSRGIGWWRLVGSGQVCSDYVQLPSKSGCEQEVAQATAKWFAIQPRKFLEAPVAIEVEGHRENCATWNSFFDTLVDRGWTKDSVPVESAWRIQLPEDWKSYELMLSKSRRRKVRKAIKLNESGELQFEMADSPDRIAELWPEFVRLHQLRRQQLGQVGVFADSNFEKFLRSSLLNLSEDRSAFIAVVTHQASPLGMLLVFEHASTWFIYQSGFDVGRIELEPGHMVNSLMLRQALNRGVREVDFLRGDEHYKKGWKSNANTLCRTILLPPGLASRGISSALKLRRNVKAWLNKNKTTAQEQSDED
ncbi:MAG: GNAT family N-acetyltransferase [Pirellulales bacterium]